MTQHEHQIPTTFCIIDKKEISFERQVKRSSTCSKECADKLTAIRRAVVDARKCRHCGRPSSPEERRLFKAFKKAQGHAGPKRGRKTNAEKAASASG